MKKTLTLAATLVLAIAAPACSPSTDEATAPEASDIKGCAHGHGCAADAGTASDSATSDGGASDSAAADSGTSSADAGGADASTPATSPGCAPLPAPTGAVISVGPSQATQLPSIVAAAKTGDTIALADGLYALGGAEIAITTPGVTLRSASGNREAVVLDGEYQSGEIVRVVASNVTIASLTIEHPINHAVHAYPGAASIQGTLVHDVHVIDPGEQGIKINANSGETLFVDDGTVACSHIEMTAAGQSHVSGCYTGGIDAHDARGWNVRDNLIEGFWCASGLSEHAVHFWTGSRDTVVERNVLRNNARGVGLGLGATTPGRTYSDAPCPGVSYVGHYFGVVRNNFIFANDAGLFASQSGFDSGISMEQACGPTVVHNSVFTTSQPRSSSIEWRFGGTTATIDNNVASYLLVARDGATATLATNLASASGPLFVDAANGDLHLASTASAALGQGTPLPAGVCADDIDRQPRHPTPDIGADEHFP